MIIQKEVEIGLSPKNIKFYEKKWYEIPKWKDGRWRISCKKWTKITVKVDDLMPTSKVKVKCKCEQCWIERFVYFDSLAYRENSIFRKTGETLCTICRNKTYVWEKWHNYKHWNKRYPEYKNNSKRRWIIFDLDINEFDVLVKWKCHYCGWNSKDRDIRSRWNWIDRKDSGLWYTKGNCVSCCATCNFIKNSMPYKQFIKYIRDLYNNTKNYEI